MDSEKINKPDVIIYPPNFLDTHNHFKPTKSSRKESLKPDNENNSFSVSNNPEPDRLKGNHQKNNKENRKSVRLILPKMENMFKKAENKRKISFKRISGGSWDSLFETYMLISGDDIPPCIQVAITKLMEYHCT